MKLDVIVRLWHIIPPPTMARHSNNPPRKPATKLPNLRKKMQQQPPKTRLTKKGNKDSK